jgi:hypothetical protein
MLSLIDRRRPRTAKGIMFGTALWATLAAVFLPTAGCSRQLDPKEYGEVIHEVPTIHTDGRPYPLPELEESDEKGDKTGE